VVRESTDYDSACMFRSHNLIKGLITDEASLVINDYDYLLEPKVRRKTSSGDGDPPHTQRTLRSCDLMHPSKAEWYTSGKYPDSHSVFRKRLEHEVFGIARQLLT
jgi:hypothetical protein